MEVFENTGKNKYAFKLVDDKQPLYKPIYSLSSIELETLRTYIKNHLKTRFICPSKFFSNVPIFFDKKPNNSF